MAEIIFVGHQTMCTPIIKSSKQAIFEKKKKQTSSENDIAKWVGMVRNYLTTPMYVLNQNYIY